MATQRYISTSFWDDEWVQEHDPSEKLFYLYLLTNPLTNIAGVYQITDRRVSFDTGFNDDVVKEMWKRFEAAGKVARIGEWLVIPSWPKHQKWEVRSKIKSGIENILLALPHEIFTALEGIGYRYPMHTLSYPMDTFGYPSNYSDPDSEKIQRQTRSGSGSDPDPKSKVDKFAREAADPNIEDEDAQKYTNEFKEKIKK